MTSFDNLFNLDLFRLLVHSFWINCLLFNYPPLSEITNKHHHHHQQFISHLFIKSPDIYRRLGSFVFYVHNSSRHITLTFSLSLFLALNVKIQFLVISMPAPSVVSTGDQHTITTHTYLTLSPLSTSRPHNHTNKT